MALNPGHGRVSRRGSPKFGPGDLLCCRWNRLENLLEESNKSQAYDASALWLLAEWVVSEAGAGVRKPVIAEAVRMLDALIAGACPADAFRVQALCPKTLECPAYNIGHGVCALSLWSRAWGARGDRAMGTAVLAGAIHTSAEIYANTDSAG